MKLSRKNILNTLTLALKQGTSPQKLAVTCALGVVIGIFPIMGTTTLVCFGLALLLRLNIAILQLVNYLMIVLQVVLIIPFFKAGIFIFGLEPFAYTKDELIILFQNDFWKLLRESGHSIAAGIGAWLLVSIPLFIILFYSCLFLFRRWRKSDDTLASSEVESLS